MINPSLLSHPRLTNTDKILAIALSNFHLQKNKSPSNPDISNATGISTAGIKNSLRRLSDEGLIIVNFDHGSDKNRRVTELKFTVVNGGAGLKNPNAYSSTIPTNPNLESLTSKESKLSLTNSSELERKRGGWKCEKPKHPPINKNPSEPLTPPKPKNRKPPVEHIPSPGTLMATRMKTKLRARMAAGLLSRDDVKKQAEERLRKARNANRRKGLRPDGGGPAQAYRIVDAWNAIPGAHAHHILGTKTYEAAGREANRLMRDPFRAVFPGIDPAYLKKHSVPARLLDEPWTLEMLGEGVRRLALLHTEEYNPAARIHYPKDLRTLIYNDRSHKSQLLRVMANYPEPFLPPGAAAQETAAEPLPDQKWEKYLAAYGQFYNNDPMTEGNPGVNYPLGAEAYNDLKPEEQTELEKVFREFDAWAEATSREWHAGVPVSGAEVLEGFCDWLRERLPEDLKVPLPYWLRLRGRSFENYLLGIENDEERDQRRAAYEDERLADLI